MYYGEIKDCDIANGEGVRVSLFVSGCTNHCEHCFQPQTWDFSYGQPFTRETEDRILTRIISTDSPSWAANPSSRKISGPCCRSCAGSGKLSREKISGLTAALHWTNSLAARPIAKLRMKCFLFWTCWWTAVMWKPLKIFPSGSGEAPTRD